MYDVVSKQHVQMTGVTRKPAENKQAMKPGKPGFHRMSASPFFAPFTHSLTLSPSLFIAPCLLSHPLYHDCRVHDSFSTTLLTVTICLKHKSIILLLSYVIKKVFRKHKPCFTNGLFKPWIALLMLVLLHFDAFSFTALQV